MIRSVHTLQLVMLVLGHEGEQEEEEGHGHGHGPGAEGHPPASGPTRRRRRPHVLDRPQRYCAKTDGDLYVVCQ